MATTVKPGTSAQTEPKTDPMEWVRKNQKLLLWGLAALGVIALGGWVTVESGKRKERMAAVQLDQARNAAESGNLPLAASELQKLIDTYRGTESAREAVITLNQVRMVNGQSELAVVGLEDYLKTNPKPDYAVPARGLLGQALENVKRFDQAAAAYEEASQGADVDYLKAQYLLSAARAYRAAGKPADATRVLLVIREQYPDTPSRTEADVRLAELTEGRMQ
ncbi:MAG TPA: tetratricopeptide repeat protein [Gemmatimonadales bacterium]|nr:tetratricopeptide repeat protein [Gemmatimonadales bacterium]